MAWTVNINVGNDRPDLLYVSAVYTDDNGNTVSVSDTCAIGNYDSLLGAAKKALDDYNTKQTIIANEAQAIADLLNNDSAVAASIAVVAAKTPAVTQVSLPAPIKVG